MNRQRQWQTHRERKKEDVGFLKSELWESESEQKKGSRVRNVREED